MAHGLRSGFTTGTCAAVAAKAAAVLLFAKEECDYIDLMTPGGKCTHMEILEHRFRENEAGCCVKKDSGDDPDVTNGTCIWAWIRRLGEENLEPDNSGNQKGCGNQEDSWYQDTVFPFLYLTGGQGIGRVTKPGLACPVGKHAINPVPRDMIFQAVGMVCRKQGIMDPLLITIEIPEGERLAKQTFNPKLGIEGGISVLGTSGIVEPMSEQALLDTIRLEIHMKAVEGRQRLILTPGNYGETFLKETMGLSLSQAVTCSNFIADAVEAAAGEGMREILFAGHIGKLIKVAAGMRNTHSKYGDHRMETLETCAKMAGIREEDLLAHLRGSNTTEEAVEHLKQNGWLESVMKVVAEEIQRQMNRWAGASCQIQVVTFSSVYGILGMTKQAKDLAERLKQEEAAG